MVSCFAASVRFSSELLSMHLLVSSDQVAVPAGEKHLQYVAATTEFCEGWLDLACQLLFYPLRIMFCM